MNREYMGIVEDLKRYANACTYFRTREELFTETRKQRAILHRRLKAAFREPPALADWGEAGQGLRSRS